MHLTFAVTGFAENLNQHSAAIAHKLDSEFEDWEFFADEVDKRVCAHIVVIDAWVVNVLIH